MATAASWTKIESADLHSSVGKVSKKDGVQYWIWGDGSNDGLAAGATTSPLSCHGSKSVFGYCGVQMSINLVDVATGTSIVVADAAGRKHDGVSGDVVAWWHDPAGNVSFTNDHGSTARDVVVEVHYNVVFNRGGR